MKTILNQVASKLTAVAVVLIFAYIGWNELFRGSRVGDDLKQAQLQSQRAQKELQYVITQLQQQHQELQRVDKQVAGVQTGLGAMKDSVGVVSTQYRLIRNQLNEQIAVSSDRYKMQKRNIQAIQKQIR